MLKSVPTMSKQKPVQFKLSESDHKDLGVFAAEKGGSRSSVAKDATLAVLKASRKKGKPS